MLVSKLLDRQVELFRFKTKNKVYNYTSSDKSVTFENEVYLPATIKRGDIVRSFDESSFLDIKASKNIEICDLFKNPYPVETKVRIVRLGRNDINDFDVIYNGIVKSCEFSVNEATFKAQDYVSLLTSEISGYAYQKKCNHKLFSKNCRLNSSDFSVVSDIEEVLTDGVSIVLEDAGGFQDGYYVNGVFSVFVDEEIQTRAIIGHFNNNIVIKSPIYNLTKDHVATIFAGCNLTSESCKTKFNNFQNFGGYEYIPNRDIIKNGL